MDEKDDMNDQRVWSLRQPWNVWSRGVNITKKRKRRVDGLGLYWITRRRASSVRLEILTAMIDPP